MNLKNIVKNSMTTIGILLLAAFFCTWIQMFSETDNHVPLLFVFAVVLVSRFTDGYVYGIIGSLIAVVGANYAFTYPYFKVNFTLEGYPLTFFVMLAVAVIVSALTTQIKEKERIHLEIEREKMRGNLLRAVSHDIRTPLTSIVGTTSLLLESAEELSEDKKQELVVDMREEAQWLIRIVENLLSITRIEGGRSTAKLDMQEELIEEIVGSSVVKFKKKFPQIQVDIRLPEELLLVPMDGILVEQVLTNLMENAVLHGKTTSKIDIVIEDDQEGNRVRIAVEDNGEGIKASLIPKIFNGKMHSEEGKESDSKRNMGIGLSVCNTIVKAHKGQMKAENKPSGGARFIFWLPK